MATAIQPAMVTYFIMIGSFYRPVELGPEDPIVVIEDFL
jgi:hypothetical protein